MTENTITASYTLTRFGKMFKMANISNDIMVTSNEENAKQFHETQDFYRAPIINDSDNIEEHYDSNEKGTGKIKKIDTSYLISESTGILETLNYLAKKHFYFILNGNRIRHIVHYPDLNNPIVLLEIYTQIAYCEITIRDYARVKNKYGNIDRGIEKLLRLSSTLDGYISNTAILFSQECWKSEFSSNQEYHGIPIFI